MWISMFQCFTIVRMWEKCKKLELLLLFIDKLGIHLVRSKCFPFIRIEDPEWVCWWCHFYNYSSILVRNCNWSVNISWIVIRNNEFNNNLLAISIINCISSVRGILGSTLVLSSNIGMLLAFTFGNYFDFYMMPKFVISLTILCMILLYFVPESPTFLVRQNKISVCLLELLHL